MSSARQGSRADRSRPDAAVSQTRACWGDEGTRFLPRGDAANGRGRVPGEISTGLRDPTPSGDPLIRETLGRTNGNHFGTFARPLGGK